MTPLTSPKRKVTTLLTAHTTVRVLEAEGEQTLGELIDSSLD